MHPLTGYFLGADDEEDASGGESELVHGHRFTTEEDAILMEAMRDYAEVASLAYIFCIHVTVSKPKLNGSYAPGLRI